MTSKKSLFAAILLSGALAADVTHGESGWQVQNPRLPQRNGLWDVAMPDPDTAIAVGYQGAIVKTDDGGKTFRVLDSGTSDHLYGVAFADQQLGLAVGFRQVGFESFVALVLRTTDGGESWTMQTLPDWRLSRVTFADSQTAVAVGSSIFRSTDAGVTWSDTHPGSNHRDFRRVSFANSDLRIVAGCNTWNPTTGCTSGQILRSTDGGLSWKAEYTGPIGVDTLAFADEKIVVATGHGLSRPTQGYYLFRSTDAGANWTVSRGAPSINDLAFAEAKKRRRHGEWLLCSHIRRRRDLDLANLQHPRSARD